MTTPTPSSTPTGLDIPYLGISANNPGNNWYRRRAPTTRDFQNYQVLDRWINILTGLIYILQSKAAGVATWIQVTTTSGGVLPVAQGGTGDSTLTAHSVLIGEGTSPVAFAGPGTTGQVLIAAGASADPAFGALGVNSGLTAHGVLIGEGNSAIVATSAGTTGQAFISGGASADPAFGTLGVVGGGTGVATIAGLFYGNGTAAVTGIVPTVTSGSAGSPQVLNNRAGSITFTGVSIAAGATLTLTNTNSSISSGSTQIIYSWSGATAGSALSVASVTPDVGTVAYVFTNGTGATTSTANITINFLITN